MKPVAFTDAFGDKHYINISIDRTSATIGLIAGLIACLLIVLVVVIALAVAIKVSLGYRKKGMKGKSSTRSFVVCRVLVTCALLPRSHTYSTYAYVVGAISPDKELGQL